MIQLKERIMALVPPALPVEEEPSVDLSDREDPGVRVKNANTEQLGRKPGAGSSAYLAVSTIR